MEYFRDPKNQIYADIAYRLGIILAQYKKLTTSEEKFESTLYLSVLQTLMTNCNEHIRNMPKGDRHKSIFYKNIGASNWGLEDSCWIKNTFNEKSSLQNFIARLRNSLSHPTQIDLLSNYPSTGYSTIINDTSEINNIRFVNSPDTNKNKLKIYNPKQIKGILYEQKRSGRNDEENETLQKSEENDSVETIKMKLDSDEKTTWAIRTEIPNNVSFCTTPNEKGYYLMQDGKPYIRVSIIELDVQQLGIFVGKLANYLAQPIQEDWDGNNINDLFAA